MATDKTANFNVGGKKYEVSRSLLENFKESMLHTSSTDMWQKDSSEEIFIERDGDRFRYCLDFMRDGKANIPYVVSKAALVADAQYYGLKMEDSAITQDMMARSVAEMVKLSEACEYYWACRRLGAFFLWHFESTEKRGSAVVICDSTIATAAQGNPGLNTAWLVVKQQDPAYLFDLVKKFGLKARHCRPGYYVKGRLTISVQALSGDGT